MPELLALDSFMDIVDQFRDAVFMFDSESLSYIYVNQSALALVGYSREELLGMRPVDLMSEYDEPRFRRLLQPLLQGGISELSFEAVHHCKDGSIFPIDIRLKQAKPEAGGALCIAVMRHIAEPFDAIGEIRRMREYVSDLLEGMDRHYVKPPDGAKFDGPVHGIVFARKGMWLQFPATRRSHRLHEASRGRFERQCS